MDVVLNEVLYDPAGADGGYEFVELAAAAGASPSLSLDGWRLETGNGSSPGTWRLAWTGGPADSLRDGLFLVGEAGVEPPPDAVADLDLQNGPDACRLVAPDGTADRLGWGEELDPFFFEGRAAVDVASGHSLARLPDGRDTEDNAADFLAASPSPGAFNAPDSLLVVIAREWPAPDLECGSAGTFRGLARNAGRAGRDVALHLECHVHPQEMLGTVSLGWLASGEERAWDVVVSPPPGVHWPLVSPGGAEAPHAFCGTGADLAVTEILAAPASGEPEWVEIVSRATGHLRLDRLVLVDAAGTEGALAGDLAPGERIVLTRDAEEFPPRWGPVGAVRSVSPWPTLNQTASEGAVAERVEVRLEARELAVGVVPGRGASGVSWERLSLALPPEDPASWAPSLDESGGTPGRPNSRRGDRVVAAGSGALSVDPQPFRPGRHGAALVIVRGLPASVRPGVDVWDSAGRLVASLSAWRHGGEVRAAWDGRHRDGSPAAVGLYVVRVTEGRRAFARASVVLVR